MAPANPAVKSTSTPVFYTSRSYGGAGTSRIPERYLDSLSRKHISLALVKEVPSSRCGSPIDDDEGIQYEGAEVKARVENLRRRVKQAFQDAHGEPADGKWDLLVQLLPLITTSASLRWLGTTLDGKTTESSLGWINATTEAEWDQWETRWAEALHLKQKVEHWQRNVEVDHPSEDNRSAQTEPEARTASAAHHPSKSTPIRRTETAPIVSVREGKSSALTFPILKRSTLASTSNAKGTSNPKLSLTPGPGSQKRVPKPVDRSTQDPSEKSRPKDIADISETFFLPPSFASGLQTSTPNAQPIQRRQPSPIPHLLTASPSVPIPSPPKFTSSPAVPERREIIELSSSLTNIPSTPVKLPHTATSTKNHLPPSVGKRPRSVSPVSPTKKSRSIPSATSDEVEDHPPPITPQRKKQHLPTLTELLASSSKRHPKPSPLPTKFSLLTRTPASHIDEVPSVIVPLHQLDAEEQENRVVPSPPPLPGHVAGITEEANLPATAPLSTPKPLPSSSIHLPLSPPSVPPFLSSHPDVVNLNLSQGLHGFKGPPSVKSLSSLAADSEDEEDELNPDSDPVSEFNPPFTSTQAAGAGGTPLRGAGVGALLGYNSQFDLKGKIDSVARFMDQDVNLDYASWLRDPSEEPEEDGM